MAPIQSGDARSSVLSQGRCYVYVLPCVYEDILKLGFSRDPVGRLQALHRRYFDFFDLDRAFLIETETVRDARRLELMLGHEFALHNAPSPLVIRRAAAGHTEWYRRAYAPLQQAAARLSVAGFVLHRPLRPWLQLQLIARSDPLYAWSHRTFDAMQAVSHDAVTASALRQVLLDTLDAYRCVGIELAPLLPPSVCDWYRSIQQEIY